MNKSDSFFLIVNPTSGQSNFKKSWKKIQDILYLKKIEFCFELSKYKKNEIEIVNKAIKNGYKNFIVVGGDGTLHQTINGIMNQDYIDSSKIKLGIIPLGTGNDWIKTYNIPNSIEKSIEIILRKNYTYQDIGIINYSISKKKYFLNVAGIGYDGYVVNKLNSLKKFGSIAYLLSGLYGLFFYKKSIYKVKINDNIIEGKCLMVLFGICQYSGGGMKMTKEANPNDGLLDITIAKNFSLLDLILNIKKLYSGKIIYHSKIETFKANSVEIIEVKDKKSFIQADGELIGLGSLKASLIKNAVQIITPACKKLES